VGIQNYIENINLNEDSINEPTLVKTKQNQLNNHMMSARISPNHMRKLSI